MSKAIIYECGEISLRELTITLPRDHYLVKPLSIYIGPVECYIASGVVPLRKPVILGHTGIVRILEAGYGASSEHSGKIAVAAPISSLGKGVLGASLNGLLAKSAIIPKDTLIRFIDEPDPKYAILFYAGVANRVIRESAGSSILIVGGGISSALIALSGDMIKSDVVALTKDTYRALRGMGIQALKDLKEVKGQYDVIVYNLLDPSMINHALKCLSEGGTLYLNPITAFIHGINIIGTKAYISVKLAIPEPKDYACNMEPYWEMVKRYVRILKIKSIDECRALIPPKPLGIILSFI